MSSEVQDIGKSIEGFLDVFDAAPKLTPYRKKVLQSFLKKIGLKEYLGKFEKMNGFWKLLNMQYIFFEIRQDDFEMPPHILEKMKQMFTIFYQNIPFTVHESDIRLTLYESYVLTRGLRYAVKQCISEKTKLYTICGPLVDHFNKTEVKVLVEAQLKLVLHTITEHLSSLEGWLYHHELEIKNGRGDNLLITRLCVSIVRQKAVQFNDVSSGELRRYLMYMKKEYDGEYEIQSLTYEGKEYQIGFLTHVFRRLEERLGIPCDSLYRFLRQNVDFTNIRTYKNKILISVEMGSKKKYRVGYLLGELRESRCLIKTFLFLSQNGTPEGDALNEKLSVSKGDKSFLLLDKLEHFVNSDYRDDAVLRGLFKECHLDHLFEIPHYKNDEHDFQNADYLREMLQLE